MLEELLVGRVWLARLIWAAIYISDYYLTIYAARLYQTGAKEHFVFEGSVELTPYFQEDVDKLRRFSPRFFLALALSSLALLVIWLAAVRLSDVPAMFSFAIGGMFLLEAAVHMRHIRNIALFQRARVAQGLKGTIEYTRWLTLKLSAIEILSFSGLFFLLFLVSGSWFFAGGTATCLATGLRHWIWGKRASRTSQQA